MTRRDNPQAAVIEVYKTMRSLGGRRLSTQAIARAAGRSRPATYWVIRTMVADGVAALEPSCLRADGRSRYRDGYRYKLTGRPLPAATDRVPQRIVRQQRLAEGPIPADTPVAPKPGPDHTALAQALGHCMAPPQPRGISRFNFLR